MSIYARLLWLLPAPADFRQRLREVPQGEAGWAALRALAGFALAGNQLDALARAMAKLAAHAPPPAALARFRLGLVGTGTLDLIAPQLVASALRHGLSLEVETVPYGQGMQVLYADGSPLLEAGCDAILLAFDHRDLMPDRGGAGSSGAAMERIGHFCRIIRDKAGAVPIVQTIAPPPETLLGQFDRRSPDSLQAQIRDFNQQLVAGAEELGAVLVDVEAVAARIGGENWHDPAAWLMAKLPFSSSFIPYYADQAARVLAAMRGLSRRVLVLDLDNTLWGGVIGDDGLDGIRLGHGTPEGEAFLQIQQYALALRDLGVVLAVSSKNEEAIARQALREHPDMLLREEHIAAFQANWFDKPANLRKIAQDLSLGLSSFVFVDDNPAERAIMRRELPEVAVPELPEDPALYRRVVAAAGYFETVALSAEDRARARFYEGNARRQHALTQSQGLDDYLDSLAMEIEFSAFTRVDRARVAQLINKSNQFNLTTRRYTERQVGEMEQDPQILTLQVRLRDTFGDNGLISAIILRIGEDGRCEIDTWLMSCRVLGRRVEQVVLDEIIRRVAVAGGHGLWGVFRPTGRNELVRDHYRKLGFALREEGEDGQMVWERDLAPQGGSLPFRVTVTD